MAINYPLTMPTVTGLANISFRAINGTLVTRSPFSFKEQVQTFGAARWEADVMLPPMKRAAAEEWIAWLMSLKGQRGTFYLGDPTGTSPRGSVASGDTPKVRNSSPSAVSAYDSLYLKNLPVSRSNYIKAGDYLQLGDSADNLQHLHKVLQDVDTDASGHALVYIWPNIRRAAHKVDDYDKVSFHSAKGVFRLASSDISWDINAAMTYGFSFTCVEEIVTDLSGEIS